MVETGLFSSKSGYNLGDLCMSENTSFLEMLTARNRTIMESVVRQGGDKLKIVSYGKARQFKTEGDMYEYITGCRSIVLDEAEDAG